MMPKSIACRPLQVAFYFDYSANCYCYIAGVVRGVPRCVPYAKQGRTIRISGPVQFPEVGGPYPMKRADLELALKHMDLITM